MIFYDMGCYELRAERVEDSDQDPFKFKGQLFHKPADGEPYILLQRYKRNLADLKELASKIIDCDKS